MQIRQFQPADADAVVVLWHEAGLTRPWNDPVRDIERKLAEQPELFLVAEDASEGTLIGSVMAGTDGHRGWLYYLAVAGKARRRRDNAAVAAIYAGLGYAENEVLVLGKRLISDL